MRPILRAICRDCWSTGEGFHTSVDELGDSCPMEHDDGKPHRLTKRLLYICDLPGHCDEMGYTSLDDLKEHQSE